MATETKDKGKTPIKAKTRKSKSRTTKAKGENVIPTKEPSKQEPPEATEPTLNTEVPTETTDTEVPTESSEAIEVTDTKVPTESSEAIEAPTDTEVPIDPPEAPPMEDDTNPIAAAKLTPLQHSLIDYVKACKSCIKEDDKRTLIKKLASVIRQALSDNDAKAAETLLTFIGEYKNTIMHEKSVFQYIRTLSLQERKRVESCYTFLMAANAKLREGTPFRLDVQAVRAALEADTFVNTIIAKLER